MIRRLVPLVLVGLMTAPTTARADDDLAEYLGSAMDADFRGSGVVMGTWGPDSAAATYEITRSQGVSMVRGPTGDFMLSGSLTASRSGADWYALELAEWSAWSLSDRYSLGDRTATTRLGRPATEVTVMEGDRRRARLVIDDQSTVPLLTEVFDGQGRVFRFAVLVEFAAGPVAEVEMPDEFMERDMLMSGQHSPRLPVSAFGYLRTDTYAMADSGTQAFYTDGLFSFSLFETGHGTRPAEFDSATRFEVDGVAYRRIVTPNNVWVHWSTRDRSYVLVGDLPPDHIEGVLGDLPRPGRRGVVMRLLSRLFG